MMERAPPTKQLTSFSAKQTPKHGRNPQDYVRLLSCKLKHPKVLNLKPQPLRLSPSSEGDATSPAELAVYLSWRTVAHWDTLGILGAVVQI